MVTRYKRTSELTPEELENRRAYRAEWARKKRASETPEERQHRLQKAEDYCRRNAEKLRAQGRARYKKNPEKFRAVSADIRARDPEKARSYVRAWYAREMAAPAEKRRVIRALSNWHVRDRTKLNKQVNKRYEFMVGMDAYNEWFEMLDDPEYVAQAYG